MTQMKLLITGAAGFIGSNLVGLLAKNSFQIKAVDCFLNESYDANLKKKIGRNLQFFQM